MGYLPHFDFRLWHLRGWNPGSTACGIKNLEGDITDDLGKVECKRCLNSKIAKLMEKKTENPS